MNNYSQIESYAKQLEVENNIFMQNLNASTQKSNPKKENSKLKYIFQCIFDYILLYLKISFSNKNKFTQNIIFVSPNLCKIENNDGKITIIDTLNLNYKLYINNSKEFYISTIDNQKVYNIGGLVTIINKTIYALNKSKFKTIFAHKLLNDSLLRKIKNVNVFTLCYYDYNGLSLVFSKYRKNFTLNEVQHGSIINFYPYSNSVNFPIIDTFYVRNTQTITFLKNNFANNYKANYNLIPYKKSNISTQKGTHILYASSMETNGFHTVFNNFLKENSTKNLNIIVRLHPREMHKKQIFEEVLINLKLNFCFDTSENWLEHNKIKNLIVISPWSSIIEEAIDNGFKAIIIDEIGKKRFENYIDNTNCFYSNTIEFTINKIIND